MKKSTIIFLAAASTLLLAGCAQSQQAVQSDESVITLNFDQAKEVIPAEIYGQFAEHLGRGIYGGIWVGENSDIPNVQGYRTDVLEALRALEVPVIRWPGGCFADYYHWEDGIGPKNERPRMVNSSWGGTVEDNSFGTHEFFNYCELLGCEPYLSANVGSGTVKEMAQWIEYITAEAGPMAELRKKNGREKPWHLKYVGIGNESWGCGGQMTPEYYSDQYRRYGEYARTMADTPLYKVGSGASDYDENWTEVLMQNVGKRMNGLSLHFYTCNWDGKGKALEFDENKYYWTIWKCHDIDMLLQKHIAIMDKYDPEGNVDLLLDEWGTWWDVEEGTNPGHLFQQNTMRDAVVASSSFDIFHKYTRRLKMTNIAQMINVLQAMILTDGPRMALTPTYHVFNMYKVHKNATYIPADVVTPTLTSGEYSTPAVSVTASKKECGEVNISLTNMDLKAARTVTVNVGDLAGETSGVILASANVNDCNTYDAPDTVKPVEFTDFTFADGKLTVNLPAVSVANICIK